MDERSNLASILKVQDDLLEITRHQAKAIDQLFMLLAQHLSAEEVSKLAAIDEIEQATKLKGRLSECM